MLTSFGWPSTPEPAWKVFRLSSGDVPHSSPGETGPRIGWFNVVAKGACDPERSGGSLGRRWARRAPDPLLRTGRVSSSTSVAVLLAEHPWLEDHLFAWGLDYVGRVRSVPRELTLGTLAASEGKDPDQIIARINEQLQMQASTAHSR